MSSTVEANYRAVNPVVGLVVTVGVLEVVVVVVVVATTVRMMVVVDALPHPVAKTAAISIAKPAK